MSPRRAHTPTRRPAQRAAPAMPLTKALYLATWELTKKWTMPVRNWGQVYAELDIMYPGRLTRN